MTSSRWPVVRRILWPERASLFVIIGGAAGLVGDITGFFSELVSPLMLVLVSGAIAAVASLLCLQRAFLVDSANEQAVSDVVQCRVCDAMRFGLFALAAFLLLFAVGKDKSATEVIASKLGLIHEDVKQIGSDVGQLRDDVSEISDIAQSQKIVSKPKTAADYFRNAWIYSNIHRDSQRSYESLQAMYENTDVQKLDAADLFYSTGVQVAGRNAVLKEMEEIATRRNDPSLLVVAGRNAVDIAEGDRLIAKALAMAPDYPFAHWDMQRFTAIAAGTPPLPAAQKAMMEQRVAGLEKFTAIIDEHPTGRYFFLPQYQPDYGMLARQNLSSARQTVENYSRIEEKLKKLGH